MNNHHRLYKLELCSCTSQVSAKHQGICPSSWHIPSDADWNVLMKYVNPSCSDNSSCAGVGTKLKANSPLWNDNSKSTDDFGFSALPGGISTSDFFDLVGDFGCWWSSTEQSSHSVYLRVMTSGSEYAYYDDLHGKSALNSIRCLKD